MDASTITGAPSDDGIAIESGFGAGKRRPALRVREPARRRGREHRHEPSFGKPPGPVAEHSRRKRASADDDACVLRRVGELRVDDRVQRQIAERLSTVPALEARLRHDASRSCLGMQLSPGLEPFDPAEAVSRKAALLGGEEMRGEHLDVRGAEPERRETRASLVGPH